MNSNSTERKFLGRLLQKGEKVAIFIRNGFQERGRIQEFDNVSLLFVDEEGVEKLIYIDAISTISPVRKPIERKKKI